MRRAAAGLQRGGRPTRRRDVDYQAMNVGLLNITGGSLATTDDKPAILMVTSLADSEIGGILPSLDWDYNPYMWIFSPIINFTVSPNVKEPFSAPPARRPPRGG